MGVQSLCGKGLNETDRLIEQVLSATRAWSAPPKRFHGSVQESLPGLEAGIMGMVTVGPVLIAG
jgi:hypothetical protein